METVSLTVAKKLSKYLPENAEFSFRWEPDGHHHRLELITWVDGYKDTSDYLYAPTLCEMLKLLPKKVFYKGRCYMLMLSYLGELLDITYYKWNKYESESQDLLEHSDINHKGFSADKNTNPATAAAELYMWYKDNMGGTE